MSFAALGSVSPCHSPAVAASQDRLGRVPGTNDHIFVALQSNEPPAACAHHEDGAAAEEHDAHEAAEEDVPEPRETIAAVAMGVGVGLREDEVEGRGREEDKSGGKEDVPWHGYAAKVTSEDRKQAKDLNAEEGEAEDGAR